MEGKRLSLGLDISTQSLSASILDIDRREPIAGYSLNYLGDPRLQGFGIGPDYILPPRIEGEADQPPGLFLAALDALFEDLKEDLDLSEVAVINVSGQQHGHVYLNGSAQSLFVSLNTEGAENSDLVRLLDGCFASGRAPIWMTSSTVREAEHIRQEIGKEKLIRTTGSDAHLRFTGIVIRNTALRYPEVYEQTSLVHLISSLIPAVLTGSVLVPADFGNACGTSLMNYRKRDWDDTCLRAVAGDLPGGEKGLKDRLPSLASPDSIVGNICPYFIRRYGTSPDCLVAAGSGDNPQSKVLVAGDLLSLGTSFVNMVATDGSAFDLTGAASAMYDGLGRPFMFGCRTNGALVWDQVRAQYGLDRREYKLGEAVLRDISPGQYLVLWQPRTESFPVSGSFDIWREDGVPAEFGPDYTGCIESSLAAVYVHSRPFAPESEKPLYVTGGAAGSPGIMRRIAAVWKRPVIPVESKGAALGAAVAGVSALSKNAAAEFDAETYTSGLISAGKDVQPLPEDIAVFHGPGGYLERFTAAEAKLIRDNPL